jgi:trimeric autotransporter adhesin
MRAFTKRPAPALLLAAVLVVAMLAAPPDAAPSPASHAAAVLQTADLAPALAEDGTFVGTPGLSGTIDASAWTLTSNLAAGERPRFESSSVAASSSIGGWSALGDDHIGDHGALIDSVEVLAVADGELYVGGRFNNVAGIPQADRVARWDGTTWHALGSNAAGTNGALNGDVTALAVLGGDVYVGGQFFNAAGIPQADFLARWDGSDWSAVGANPAGTNGALNGAVFSLLVAGDDLLVGGAFTDAAGIAQADYIARWDGATWSALGSNAAGTDGALNGTPRALALAGSDLFVGGHFQDAAGIAQADYIARWDGATWSALGSNAAGTDGALNHWVGALVVSGTDLYIGGDFTDAAGIAQADYMARWNGNGWSALGSNPAGTNGALNSWVFALAMAGTDLYVGGDFTNAAGIAQADYVARWDETSWSAVGSDPAGTNGVFNHSVWALAVAGDELYAGGPFTDAAGITQADYIARWDGASWTALGASPADGLLNGAVLALAVSGTDLYVGGAFTNVAKIPQADYIARWDGVAWHALGADPGGSDGALTNAVEALAVSGDSLYVGGHFFNAAGIAQADRVARWDGSNWSALGTNPAGTDGALADGSVNGLAVAGNNLYVGGSFTDAAGIPQADYVARWDGASWHALGANPAGTDGALPTGWVEALAVSGTDLYVGGFFINAAGIAQADFVARWDGASWHALGANASGSDGALNDWVFSLAVSGSDVYVGGGFTDAADIAQADSIARWDGGSWSALGADSSGTDGAFIGDIRALAMHGSSLYVGGGFHHVAGDVMRWDGTSWSSLGSNGSGTNGALNDRVRALAITGSDLYVGGLFTNAAGIGTADYVARFAPLPLEPCTEPPFSDVAIDHPFCAEIEWMKESGVSTGFNDGTYRPTIAVTRQAMSAFMARLAGATLTPCTEPPFSDVAIDHPFCAEIKWMKESDVSAPASTTAPTGRPSPSPARRCRRSWPASPAPQLTPCTEAPFSDVAIDHPFCAEIKWMKESGVSTGFNDGTYRPTIAVTRQAMSALMYRVGWLLP